MTTKTDDIKLPPLFMPGPRGYDPDEIRAWGRAAVEADRRGRVAKLPESDKLDQFRGVTKMVPSEELADLIARLRALARYEHDDMSVADEAADALMAPPAAGVEPPKLTDDEIEQLVIQLGVTWKEDAWKIEDADLHPMVRALLYRYTVAPVAQEQR